MRRSTPDRSPPSIVLMMLDGVSLQNCPLTSLILGVLRGSIPCISAHKKKLGAGDEGARSALILSP
jgi:hypothetical protein